MSTINQPKPSQPKAPQPDQQPLNPGATDSRANSSADPRRPNVQTPDDQSDRISGRRDR